MNFYSVRKVSEINVELEELKAFTKKCARGSHFPVNDDGWFFAVESAKRG